MTTALMFPTGELPRVTRSIPEQRMQPVPTEPAASDCRHLVERAQGDGPDAVRAMAEIYTRYHRTVFRFIFFRVKHRELAEDLTSETFLRAQRRIRSFQWTGTDFGAWLIVIARNQIADHFKSGRYRFEMVTGDVLDADEPSTGLGSDPAAAAVEALTHERLADAIRQLNPHQEAVIRLRFLRQLSIEETAEQLHRSVGAVKALQSRAVSALRRILPGSWGDDLDA